MSIKVIQGGFLTTVQDLGRFYYQQFGVSPGGAMDGRSLRLGNILVGNDENTAGLELTATGPLLEFWSDTVIAVTGGDMQPCINHVPIQMYRAIRVKKGDMISFRGLKSGFRSYLTFSGGVDVEPIMGSRSTLLKAGIGGYKGRKLQTGDMIPLGTPRKDLYRFSQRVLPQEDYSSNVVTLRILLGPQEDRFTANGLRTLLKQQYCVSEQCDRMGYRLEGPAIEHKSDANIITDGIALGSIQVPGDGKPIIMMADRQSTGGYTKIGTVISSDIPKLAQCRPGTMLQFQTIDIEKAQAFYRQERREYEDLKEAYSHPILEWTITDIDDHTIILTEI